MIKRFAFGDHVGWKSEVGRVGGAITKLHVKVIDFRGHAHHAGSGGADCEIQSDTSE